MHSAKEFNDIYGQVELDYQDNRQEQNEEEAWVMQTTASCNDMIKKYGVKFFLDSLPNHAKIAISVYYRNLQNNYNKNPNVVIESGDPF